METTDKKPRKTWVLTDGKVGMVSQAMGLANAIGFETVNKTLRGGFPWRWIPANLWPPGVHGLSPRSDEIDGPPPDLVIGCGRHAVGPALWLKRRHSDRIFVVHVQHPRAKVGQFDLVVAPEHDGLTGPNVLSITGSLHGVTEAGLADAARRFAPRFTDAPHPLIAVLIGGNNGVYSLDIDTVDRLIAGLTRIADLHGARLLITASRRTGAEAEAKLRAALANIAVDFWDGTGENPYHAYLAMSDAIVVTCDSVNMISEACSTGKPVYILRLPGGDGTKFADFHTGLIESGRARYFDNRLESWSAEPLRETERIAREVRRRMGLDRD